MALMKCPECGTDVSDKAESCPKCAFPITKTSNLPSEDKSESERKPVIANTNAKWKHVSWITYLAIGLLFLLPFCDISCSGRKVLTLTGSTMVTGASITPAVLGNEFGQSREIPANLYAILALTSVVLGLFISLIVRGPNIISGLLGLACSGFLIVLQVTINQKLSELQIDLFSANYTVAYWIVLVGGIFIAIVNFSTADYKIAAPREFIWYAVWAIIIIGIFSFIISQFDPTAPLKFRPVLSSANSESSLFSFGPSPKELEEKRIADSIRVADSIAMVQAEQQRVNDSISSMEFLSSKVLDSIFKYNFSKAYTRCKIFTPSGNKDSEGRPQGSWSEVKKTVTVIDFQVNSKNEIVLHNPDGSISTYNNVGERTFQKLSDGTKSCSLIGTSNKGNKKIIQYLENGSIAIFDNSNSSGVLFIP